MKGWTKTVAATAMSATRRSKARSRSRRYSCAASSAPTSQVVRRVGGRWRDGPVVRQEDKRGREHRRAKEGRRAPVAEPVDDSPQRVQRIQGDTRGDEQVRQAELHVRDEEAPHAEQDER